MNIKMTLLSDTIFGSGRSVPGDADIYPQTDEYGFPYLKGSTFKGIFRETLQLYLGWTGKSPEEAEAETAALLGTPGADRDDARKLVFADFSLSDAVKAEVLSLPGTTPEERIEAMTNLRTFTRISDEGTAAAGSLRNARCINKGLTFYSSIQCAPGDEKWVEEVLGMIKWVGTMRNRGFGKVKISRETESGSEGEERG